MQLSRKIDALLDTVQKPARYIGGEMNAAVKDWDAAEVRYAFCFPDVYEIGMSHLGMKILYEIINAREDALCERVFAPWVDMAEGMRREGVPLFTLETRRPVKDFDLVGFTLQYEMSYTSILEMLDLAGIPVLAAERGENDPIVIAGGPCAFNPEPLHRFIDAFTIGDGEESVGEIIDVIKAAKAEGISREETLRRLTRIEGTYVPAFYAAEYNDDGTLRAFHPTREGVPEKIRKCIVKDLDTAAFPEKMIVPFQEIIHDRIMLEVMRGCTRGCRFCQAGMLYRPVRERRVETLTKLAEKLTKSTGYDEISLSSLSTGDYSCLPQLTRELNARFEKERVSLSLPSLRLDKPLSESLEQTQKVRKSSLTFAPEAGTQRMRDVINKGVTEEDLRRTAHDAFSGGWNAIKLYFMIGLPTETEEDLNGIMETARAVVSEYFAIPKGERPRGLRVTVSVSSFVPKPFTPFQWEPQDTIEMIQQKQQFLRDVLRPLKSVDFRWHEPHVSMLEACFARGDRRMADVLYEAWKRGCNFDSWSEQFKFDTWMEAFAACGVDPAFYANRRRSFDELLPWAFIDAGVTQRFLKLEMERAARVETTPDCRLGCRGCGLMEVCQRCE